MPIPPVRFYETMVELVHLGVRAHTDGDVFAHLRDEHVVFAGDPMWSDYRPNIEGADIQGHIKALKQILRMKPGVIVPGYGPVAKIEKAQRFIEYLETMDMNIQSMNGQDLAGPDLIRNVLPPSAQRWKMSWLGETSIRHLMHKARP